MPWRNAETVPFSRLAVAAHVPSESGVFAIMAGDACLLVSAYWNLKARLLELINNLLAPEELSIVYELCPESEFAGRIELLQRELLNTLQTSPAAPEIAGLRFWADPSRPPVASESDPA